MTTSAPAPIDMTYVIQLKDGFTVRITRFKIRKEFYDHHHGGRGGALEAALKFRDEQRVLNGIKVKTADSSKPASRLASRTKNNIIAGVYLNFDKGSGYFICQIHDGTSWQKKRFSIKKLGYAQAFWGAIDLRLASSDLPVEIRREDIELYRPSKAEHALLVTLADDIPPPNASNPKCGQESGQASPEP